MSRNLKEVKTLNLVIICFILSGLEKRLTWAQKDKTNTVTYIRSTLKMWKIKAST